MAGRFLSDVEASRGSRLPWSASSDAVGNADNRITKQEADANPNEPSTSSRLHVPDAARCPSFAFGKRESIPQPNIVPYSMEKATGRSRIIPKAVNAGDRVKNQSQSSDAALPKTGSLEKMGKKYKTLDCATP
ncbi:f57856bb-9b28-46f0-849b-2c1d7b139a24, partial [Thermothielavioides terrestris]